MKIEQFKTILKKEIESLEIRKIENVKLKGQNENFADPLDKVSQEDESIVANAILNKIHKRINRLKIRLNEVNKNPEFFDSCECCGADIPDLRLSGYPEETNCVDCLNIIEIKSKRFAA